MSQVGAPASTVGRRRRWPWYLLLFLFSWLFAGVVMMPLSVIRPLLQLPAEIQVSNLSGSIWQGSALARVRDGKKQLPPVTVHGGLIPISLLKLKPALRLRADSTGVQLSARLGLAGKTQTGAPLLAVSNLHGQISAMSPWIAQYIPFDLGGRFTLQSPRLLLDRSGPREGKLTLDWLGSTLDTTQTLQLGHLRAEATLNDGRIDGQIRSVASSAEPLKLRLKLSGALGGGAGLRVRGSLGAGPAASETLREQLRMIGRPGADGMIAINQVLRP